MSTGIWVLIAVAAVILAAVIVTLLPLRRRMQLRSRFGPEYDRAVEQSGDRRTAEHELAQRERRHADLDLHDLSAEQKRHYAGRWALVQERFIDDPQESLTEADRLISSILGERGYPTGGFDQQVADLSVEHAAALDHYRAAHAVANHRDSASTEDIRGAIVHYRELFHDLVGAEAGTTKGVQQ
ncbi:MAG: hypothetical protein HOQ24_13095 [Mycobacteriaceae bacterium]|nr:hypothetical protein [Mycobacteriaceae bacterium]